MGSSWQPFSISPPALDMVSGNATRYIPGDMLAGHLRHFDFALNGLFFLVGHRLRLPS